VGKRVIVKFRVNIGVTDRRRSSTSTDSHQNGLPKETTLNNQCSLSTHVVLNRQHGTVANSSSLSRTTIAVSYNKPQL